MDAKRWILGVCLVVVGANVLALPASQKSNYQVSEILSVVSPVSFQCKLADYKHADKVRFIVQIRGLAQPQQANVSDYKTMLKQMLLTADKVELRNVRFRNYFRVEADLWINQKEAAPMLLANGWTRKAVPNQLQQPLLINTPQKVIASKDPIPAKSISTPTAVRPVVPYRNLSSLLNTPVDCSVINSDTTFEEALDILGHSVDPPLPLLVMWADLEINAYVEKDMPIGTDGFRIMRLGDALDIVLRSVSFSSGVKPIAVTKNGFLTIGTADTLMSRPIVKVYSIEDLLAMPSTAGSFNGNGMGGGGLNGMSNGSGGFNGSNGQGGWSGTW